jgi:hypothetical protein
VVDVELGEQGLRHARSPRVIRVECAQARKGWSPAGWPAASPARWQREAVSNHHSAGLTAALTGPGHSVVRTTALTTVRHRTLGRQDGTVRGLNVPTKR